MKKTLKSTPELFFMGMGIFWAAEDYFAAGTVNYFALLVTWLLFLQIFYKNRIAGVVYGVTLGSFSGYMVLSDVLGYQSIESATIAVHSIVFGLALFSVGIFMGVAMAYRYATATIDYDESVLTVTY